MKLFLDMDGVLCDFQTKWERHLGFSSKLIKTEDQFIEHAKSLYGTDFYSKLEKTKDCDSIIKLAVLFFGDYDILSRPMVGDEANCAKHKSIWIANNLKIEPRSRIYVHSKDMYATDSFGLPNILIDDHRSNCEKFVEAGGIAIKFKSGAKSYDITDLSYGLHRAYLDNTNPRLIDLKRKYY